MSEPRSQTQVDHSKSSDEIGIDRSRANRIHECDIKTKGVLPGGLFSNVCGCGYRPLAKFQDHS